MQQANAARLLWRAACLAVVATLAVACSPPRPGGEISGLRVIGEAGRQPGQFSRPRAIAITSIGELVVLDRTGRIQVVDLETGDFLRQWWLEMHENGTPTGITVDPADDTLWVADTHYHRILQYSTTGELLFQFGEMGTEPGYFVYPTDVAVDPAGQTLWVTDYGRRNRVIRFTRQGEFLMEFGEEIGHTSGLDRPQSIVTSADGSELFVIDAGNSRVNVYNTEGVLLRHISSPGSAPGQLKYPLDISWGPGGLLYIAEYENCRISRFTADGVYMGSWGEPGRTPGRLFAPWGVAVGPSGEVVIADTNNQRLQVIDRPERFFNAPTNHRAVAEAPR